MSHIAYPPPGTSINKQVTGAAAIVTDDRNRVLLQRREDNGYWGLPGGGVDPGETVSAACIREVKEETNLEVEILRLHGVYSDPAIGQLIRYPDGTVAHIIAVVFVCRVVGGDLKISHESTEAGWFEMSALPEPMTPSHRVRIADFQSDCRAGTFNTWVK